MKNLKRVVIKEELVVLTGDFIQAIILNQFIHLAEKKNDNDKDKSIQKEELGWFYKGTEELSEETMLGLSKSAMERYINALLEKGWIEKSISKNKGDNSCQYRVNLRKIQYDLQKLGFCLEGYPLLQANKKEERKAKKKDSVPNVLFDDEIQPEVIDAYSEINSKIGQAVKAKLLDLQNKYNLLLLLKAIEVASQNNGKTIGYIQTILEDWSSKGLKTPDEVDEHLRKWKEANKKAREYREKALKGRGINNNNNKDISNMRNYQEREYDEDFFKNLYKNKL